MYYVQLNNPQAPEPYNTRWTQWSYHKLEHRAIAEARKVIKQQVRLKQTIKVRVIHNYLSNAQYHSDEIEVK